MASTRNNNMYGEFCQSESFIQKQSDYRMDPTFCKNDRPALPYGVNAPHMPATLLANNSVDIENYLYGIGANNYIFPKKQTTPQPIHLQPVTFYKPTPLYIPILPAHTPQRPF
jgi:hypothetical protein